MAGWPVRRSAQRALEARAHYALGTGASAADYLVMWLARGFTMGQLADALALDIGRSFGRSSLAGLVKYLAPDAPARVRATRSASRSAMRAILDDMARHQASRDAPPETKAVGHLQLADIQHAPTAREAYASL